MWWIVIGVCLWGGWPMAAAQSANLSTMTHSLQNEIMDLMDEEVQYSKPVINTTYVANVEFDMRAMGPLYNSTHIVIDAIAKKQAYPEGVVSVEDYHVNVRPLRAEWRPLLAHYAGPVSVLAAAALFAAALPLAGLFWCCCYWCRAGRRRRPFDRKYDACRKGLLAIVLIALLTLFLFGVVCAFATESQVESGSAGAASSVRAGVHDAQQYLNATQAHARWLLVRNYRELKDNLDRMLSGVGVTMSVRLGEQSRAVSVSTLLTLVQRLDDVQAQLRRVQLLTTALRANADKLNSGLRKVKSQLLRTLSECDQPKCVTLKNKYKIGQLDTEIQYSQMPDVSELLENVTALLDSNIKEEVAEGQKVFRNIQRSIQRSIDEHVPNVQSALAETGRRLERVADEVTWRAGNASAALGRHGAAADALQRAHERYGPYRRYAGVAAAVALLAVTCLMVWGLVCGVCGKRPDVYGASDCCNKGAGAKGLLCGTGVTFVVGGAVALVLVPYFAVGLAGQRFLCDPLTEPRGNRLFADLEKVVDLEYTMYNERRDPEFTLASVLVRCHQNDTIYKTLQLQRLYEVQSVRAEVQEELARRVAQLTPPPRREPLAMLQPAAKDKLRWLAHTGLSDFDFDRILSALETNMTSLALDALVRQLNSTARSLSQPAFRQPAAELARAAADLAELNARVLQPMLADSAALNSTATALRDGMRLNYPSLKVAITYLMHETEEAEQFLNTQGPQHLQNMTKQFANVIAGKVDRYIELVEHAARYEVGRCGPLSNAFNATRDAACKKILMPVNGYWISLAWCAVLLVPLLVLAPRLARLYLHLDPYPGPLVEAEYLYDAYADRDNIPLANAYKVEKRSGREGRARGEGEARGGGRALEAGGARPEAAVAPPLDAHHARRYNDMAPKHWEEGPPRYHGPAEYERPPPYYYPGPADRQ